MEINTSSANDLKTIRKIMEESTRFLSLSGFSGVFLGLIAIAGALIAWLIMPDSGNLSIDEYLSSLPQKESVLIRWQLALLALGVLLLSLAIAFGLSFRKALRSGENIWTPVSRRLVTSLFIPMTAGGLFALILLMQNQLQLIIPVFLIFYGLALINAGKFTYGEIFYMGILEIITGLTAALIPHQGLLFWIAGFGILHIGYGLFMYRKYEA